MDFAWKRQRISLKAFLKERPERLSPKNPQGLGCCGPGTLPKKWKSPKVVRGGCKRSFWLFWAECTKIAHRRSLAIFAADSGIAVNSAVGMKFVPFNRRENRRSLAIFFAEEIARASWGLIKNRAILRGSGKNRRRNRRESRDFGALSFWG